MSYNFFSESDTYQNGSGSPGSSTQSRYTEEFVLELQQELVKARLREAEATVQLNEAHDRINQLEFDYRFFDFIFNSSPILSGTYTDKK